MQRAVSLGTDDPNDFYSYVHATGTVGRTSTSRPHVEHLARADPLNSVAHLCCVVQDFFEGRFEAALASVRVALRLDPTNVQARGWAVYLMARNGRLDEARALLDEWRTDTPEHLWVTMMTSLLCAFEGRHTESSSLWRTVVADKELFSALRFDPVGILWFAEFHTMIGETDEAIEWLEHGVELGLINYPFLAEQDRLLDGLRSDPRFQKLMVRVKKRWVEFEA